MECKLCVMDDSDEDIIFNESGVCNYCIDSSASYKNLFNISEIEAKENLNNYFNEIRFKKKTGDYDAIIG